MAGASDVKAGEAYVVISAKLDQLRADLKKGQGELSSWGKGLGMAFSPLAGALAVATAGVAGAVASFREFASVGSEINDMAARTGLATDQLQHLKFAAVQSGSSLNDVERAARSMAKNGLNVSQMEQIGESIAGISDPTERAARAMDVFGKSGTKLLPMFAELKSLKASSISLGPILTPEEVKLADELGDAFSALKESLSRLMQQIGATFGKELKAVLDTAIGMIATLAESIKTANPFGQGGDLLDNLVEWEKSLFSGTAGFQQRGAAATSGLAGSTATAGTMEDEEASAKHMKEAADSNRAMWQSIEKGIQARNSLIREFETPAEKFLRKQREIVEALQAVNRNRVLGFVGEGDSAAQRAGLEGALGRLRTEEGARLAALFKAPEASAQAAMAEVMRSSRGTFSAAGAGMLGRGGESAMERKQDETNRILKKVETNTAKNTKPKFR